MEQITIQEERERKLDRINEMNNQRISDYKAEIKDLKQRMEFKDYLLDHYFEMFKEIYKSNLKVNDLIEREFTKEDLLNL